MNVEEFLAQRCIPNSIPGGAQVESIYKKHRSGHEISVSLLSIFTKLGQGLEDTKLRCFCLWVNPAPGVWAPGEGNEVYYYR